MYTFIYSSQTFSFDLKFQLKKHKWDKYLKQIFSTRFKIERHFKPTYNKIGSLLVFVYLVRICSHKTLSILNFLLSSFLPLLFMVKYVKQWKKICWKNFSIRFFSFSTWTCLYIIAFQRTFFLQLHRDV
jgi:hypothetical protein